MNVYFVLSEELTHYYSSEPPAEYGCICEIVRAATRSQAKWLAWKNDKSFEPDVLEMPSFAIRKLGEEDGDGTPEILARDSPWWGRAPDVCSCPNPKAKEVEL